jgi:hypothetical protein
MEGKQDYADDQQNVHEEVRYAECDKSEHPNDQQKTCNSQQHCLPLPVPGSVLIR